MSSEINKGMFREYDLRGRFNENELNPHVAELVGKAYGTFLKKRKINKAIVGHDSKEVSQKLKQPFINGLRSTGCDVTDIGMVLTPIFYFSQYLLKIKGGAMISGSHNPGDWTGFKFALGYSYTLREDEMKELYETTASGKFVEGKGKLVEKEIISAYTDDIISRIKLKRPLKVVVNSGNGTAGAIAPEILREAGCEVVELYSELDSSYPHHNPDPALVSMMEATGKKVKKEKADMGVAYDGDGDRLGITDEKGKTIWPDRYLILLARQVLKKNPGAKIVFDVKCSQAVEEDIKAQGGVPIMWKTGHSHIKKKLHDEKALLAGEMSGHMFFVDGYYGFDDAIFASLKLLEYTSSQNKKMSEVIMTTPYYESTPTLHADCPDDKKYGVVDELTKEFQKEYEVITINGARVLFGDGWGLVRASSNLPVLVLRFEAKTKSRLKEIEKIFRQKLEKFDCVGKEWKEGG